MKVSQGFTNAVRSLARQIGAHTGQPCGIAIQPGDPSEGVCWEVFSDDVGILLHAPSEAALYVQVKAYSQGYAAATSTPSKEQA
jgi:hypothetical protein